MSRDSRGPLNRGSLSMARAAVACAALALLVAPCVTLAQGPGGAPGAAAAIDHPSIIVTGIATKSVPADLAVISLGVTTSAKTVKPAADENAKLMAQVLAALEKVGVAKDDIATGQFSIMTQSEYSSSSTKPSGYQVVNTLTIRSRRMDLAPQIIDAATAAGANRVDGVLFTLASPEQHRSLALADAVLNAGADAKRVADAAGVKLGPVRRMVVGGGASDGPRPMFRGRAMEMAAASDGGVPTSLTPGTIEITSAVTIEYDIAP